MTGWSEVISAAKLLIDDVRWQKELETSAARFFRAKSDFVRMAIPRLNRPPGLLNFIQSGMVEPVYDSYSWVSTQESTEMETEVSTGMLNYGLCTVSLRSADGLYETPYTDFNYYPEDGIVEFGIQPEAGLTYEIDFYNDGEFADLSEAQMRLFARAVAVVWDERFERNWLNMQPKIHDSSFSTVNEANYQEKASLRLQRSIQAFEDELRKYEQDCAYRARFQPLRTGGLF